MNPVKAIRAEVGVNNVIDVPLELFHLKCPRFLADFVALNVAYTF